MRKAAGEINLQLSSKYVSFIAGNSPDESISFIPISPAAILSAGSLI
jgi:hypothetical protein